MATAVAARTYVCARCGRKLRVGEWLYSSWTHSRYCTNVDECARRASRKARA